MAEIVISGVSRSFGTVRAVDKVDLTVGDGEFFTLLGPSGCGKTTLLRMIAGFCELDSGEIRFGRQRIDQLPAHVRDIGMVFQNYAVFPNLTVAGNVAYGLKARKVAGAEIDRRVDEALALVQLTGYGARWPHQLSGGQLQRVAIARALVIRPQVLLFDEPLSNLDARLRVNMRTEIRELQKSLGITAIYVTHDQEEAMSVSDRIALMNAGRLEQVGVPVDIYRHPVSRFAAEFMGTTNLLAAGTVGRTDGGLVSLRPEALRLAADAPAAWPRLAGTVARLELLGPLVRLDMTLADGTLVKAALLDQPGMILQADSPITLAFDPARLTVLPVTLVIPHGRRLPLAIAALGLLFLGLFLLYPLFNVFSASLLDADGEKLTFANYTKVLGRPFYRTAILNTLGIGLAATVITTVLAVPFAFALARLPIPGKSAILALAALPLVLPSFVSAYAIVLLLGRSGIVTRWLQSWDIGFGSIYGAGGIVLVYTLTLYPYVLLPTIAAFKAVDVSMEEAAQGLGSSPRRTLWTVTLPIVLPAILAGALLVFIETLENFGVPFVLAEDMPIFAVEAFKLFIGETAPNPASAGVLGVLLILTTTLVLLVQRRFLSARRFATNARQAPPILKVDLGLQAAATLYCWTIVFLALVPFLAIIVLSFMEFRGPVLHPHFSLANFAALFDRSLRPLFNTLLFATLAAVCVTLIGVPIGYTVTRFRSSIATLLDVVATLPFAVAGTVLAIGFVVSFNSGALVLTGGPLILVLAYSVRKVPFAVRSASAIVHQIDVSLEEASVSLGRSPLQTFMRIVVPLMLGGILSGVVLTWVTVASELSATVVLYSGPWRTMTVVMFQALEGSGAGLATAAASTVIVVTLLPILLLYRLVRRYELSML